MNKLYKHLYLITKNVISKIFLPLAALLFYEPA
jgi:hypothetical protein